MMGPLMIKIITCAVAGLAAGIVLAQNIFSEQRNREEE